MNWQVVYHFVQVLPEESLAVNCFIFSVGIGALSDFDTFAATVRSSVCVSDAIWMHRYASAKEGTTGESG